ncbi:carbon-phosphorus lyase complex subunit PhnI [Clostridium paraputrificum]|uniref:carbon-phosphorus lyase complex subunit PhnI n=1 Tax=Clostridium TaxID=1485 RepID=UPI003D35265B
MGYVAVKGGTKAIEESINRLKYERLKEGKVANVKNILSGMRGMIDQVMSEASIYSRELAALAIKQSEGNIEEAVFLLRAYRSTLPRKHYTRTVESSDMWVERRISASFKDILGGQILGATYDYTHRLLDFDLLDETEEESEKWISAFNNKVSERRNEGPSLRELPKVLDYLRKEGLIKDFQDNNEEPSDITKKSLEFPTKRSERLQSLTRGQTGGINSLAYSALRSCGIDHPTVGELRVGKLPLYVADPISENSEIEGDYYIGAIRVTEVESFIPTSVQNDKGESEKVFEIGYGICYGQNETKAIAMSILDQCLEKKDKKYPTGDEEFVLYNIDSVESTGFLSHLKLPHYVTFQSELDSIRKTHKGEEAYEG